ncbi:ABC transporter ATP-binding protein [Micromonospora sp. NPDC049559]|uniref:ABC transporter ATP-binding protein n=1 Tax=Micromonospora sp. NPDC049559 TaxID=3155923 RepID=UPI00343951B8
MTVAAPSRGAVRRAAAAAGLAWNAGAGITCLAAGLAVLGGVLPVATAGLMGRVVDELAGGEPFGATVGALVVVGLLAAVLPAVERYAHDELNRRARLRAQDRLYAAVNSFTGLARFEQPAFLDRLRLAEQSGANTPRELLVTALGVGQTAITLASFLVTLALLLPGLAAVVVVAATPGLLVRLRLGGREAELAETLSPASRRRMFFATLLTDQQAAKEIRIFGLGGFLHGRMRRELVGINSAERRLDRRTLLAQVALAGGSAVVAGWGLFWAVSAAAAGRLSIGSVAVVVAAVAAVQAGLGTLAGHFGALRAALRLFGHYLDVLDLDPGLPAAADPRPLPRLRRGIELRDVWFRYAEDQPWVLAGVDLTIPAGGSLALVGLNGAGKSTLVKLLCRLYDPQRGAILWDGVDLRAVEIAELRRRIGVVFQDYMAFDLTAAENIALGDLDAVDDRGRVVAAARYAGVHETVTKLAHGYDTLLSRLFVSAADGADPTTGVLLSGGQWQRLALARALMRDACDLLILDEPSSGLDAEAEHDVHTRLRRHRTGRTSLLISHRLNTVREADRIVVLAGGEVVESGDHATLMALDGAYARLFRLQSRGYADGAGDRDRSRDCADGLGGGDRTGGPDPAASSALSG